ncbi:MAG: hypothetical protein ACOYN3_06705 [Acidimicrobiia bacterium]
MQILVNPEGLRDGIDCGRWAVDQLGDRGRRIKTVAGFAHVYAGADVVAVAEVVSAQVDELARRLDSFQSLLDQLHMQTWAANAFGSSELFNALAVLAKLVDGDGLSVEVRAIVDHIDRLDASTQWMESLTVEARRQWLVLLSLRWLPQLNAAGTGNCFDGVLRYFRDQGFITPGSFASIVDANILCAFHDGIARMFRNGDDLHPWTQGSELWQRFFQYRREQAPGSWDEKSQRLWAFAEQRSTEAGYAWAQREGARPTELMQIITLGSEIYRWLGRQAGTDSDPIRLLPNGTPPVLDLPGWSATRAIFRNLPYGDIYERVGEELVRGIGEQDVRWLLDPRNPQFTYVGATMLDTAVRSGVAESPLQNLHDPTRETVSAKQVADNARLVRAGLDGTRPAIITANKVQDGVETINDVVERVLNPFSTTR